MDERTRTALLFIGDFFKQRRIELGMSQEDLAEILEVDRSTISKIESAKWNYTMQTFFLFLSALQLNFFCLPKELELPLNLALKWREFAPNEN